MAYIRLLARTIQILKENPTWHSKKQLKDLAKLNTKTLNEIVTFLDNNHMITTITNGKITLLKWNQ